MITGENPQITATKTVQKFAENLLKIKIKFAQLFSEDKNQEIRKKREKHLKMPIKVYNDKNWKIQAEKGVLRLILSKINYNCQRFLKQSKLHEDYSKFHCKIIEFCSKIP